MSERSAKIYVSPLHILVIAGCVGDAYCIKYGMQAGVLHMG